MLKKSLRLFLFLLLLPVPGHAADDPDITFESSDGLRISADSYISQPADAPLIVLFHQAGWSRGEYSEIAPKLNRLGFNCIAVDLRSGDYVNGVLNETAERAREEERATRYADALPDIIAALRYARKHYPQSKIIAWGSSYSAALVLKVAGDHPELADGVLAFSPGEYFAHLGKSKTWIRDSAKKIKVPVFITSAQNEPHSWQPIYNAISSKAKQQFIPQTEGNHGSRALWEKFSDNRDYWQAVNAFLQQFQARQR